MAESCTAPAETSTSTEALGREADEAVQHAQAIAYLEDAFPAWDIAIDSTSGWNGKRRELWEAVRTGHHPQRALTAGKLYRRLDEYEDRERQRRELASKVL